MILTDLLSEYKYVYELLKPCEKYFSTCENLIINFFDNSTNTLYPHSSADISPDLMVPLYNFEKVYNNAYIIISQMLVLSPPLHRAIAKLEDFTINNPALNGDILSFIKYFQIVNENTNEIILEQDNMTRKATYLTRLIGLLLKSIHNYHTLLGYYHQFATIDEMLFEHVPDSVVSSDKYNRIELYSQKPSLNMDSFIDDVKNLSSFICQFELIMAPENSSYKIYTQRIESGSLRIVWGSNTIELSGISDILKAISDGIRIFRFTSAEKRLKNEEARALKLQNDEKELAIINSQINSIAQITGLSSENPDDVEKLQKLCLPIVRYLYSNPVGSIGDYNYDINNDLKLIETTFNTNTES